MEGSLRVIASSLEWIAIMLTFHVFCKDCNGSSAIRELEETISKRLDKIAEKIDQIK